MKNSSMNESITDNGSAKRKTAYWMAVVAGILFTLYYLYLAADDVVYSDYIRLINAYLPDVGNPDKFFVPDILTRVPITYLGRIINVGLFDYNTMFDMILGVLGMGLGAAVLAAYAMRERHISYLWFGASMILFFGLNKWEMLTNGTGWVCFLSISGFYWHYSILDRAVRTGHQNRRDRVLLLLLPTALTLLVAGPYCGSYSALLTLVYLVLMAIDFKKKKKVNLLYAGYLAAVLIPLFFYLLSNSSAVYVHRGAVDAGLLETVISQPVFFIKFMLKAFASALVGMNQLNELAETGMPGEYKYIYLLGLIMIGLYLYSLFLTWRYKTFQRTILPLLLVLNGGINHLLILSARWIFMKDTYGMSPRYAIQYQMGLIGILWTFAVVRSIIRERQAESAAIQSVQHTRLILTGAAVILMLAGSLFTTWSELQIAPYRKAFLAVSREVGLHYETASDEDLNAYLQHDPDEVRKAMGILKESKLNIFKE